MNVYVTWNGTEWLVKEQGQFDLQKAGDTDHPGRWWECWRLLPEPVADHAAALAEAGALWGANGEGWTDPREG